MLVDINNPVNDVRSIREQFCRMLNAQLLALASYGTYSAVTMTTVNSRSQIFHPYRLCVSAPAVVCVAAALTGSPLLGRRFLQPRFSLLFVRVLGCVFLEDLGHVTVTSPDILCCSRTSTRLEPRGRASSRRASLLAADANG